MRHIKSVEFATERMVAAKVPLGGFDFSARLRFEARPDFLFCLFCVRRGDGDE